MAANGEVVGAFERQLAFFLNPPAKWGGCCKRGADALVCKDTIRGCDDWGTIRFLFGRRLLCGKQRRRKGVTDARTPAKKTTAMYLWENFLVGGLTVVFVPPPMMVSVLGLLGTTITRLLFCSGAGSATTNRALPRGAPCDLGRFFEKVGELCGRGPKNKQGAK
jgi:hypothetical protein